jgi:hypothetical protein
MCHVVPRKFGSRSPREVDEYTAACAGENEKPAPFGAGSTGWRRRPAYFGAIIITI